MSIVFRRFDSTDLENVGRVFAATLNDLMVQAGAAPYIDLDDESAWRLDWERNRRSLFEHLTAHDGQSWLAEQDGEVLGYARSILRDGMCQLTEFFVLPGKQSSGIGRELLARAFDSVDAAQRTIIATTRPTAMARYLKSGVYPLCPVCDFERVPEPITVETDLTIERMDNAAQTLEALDRIDLATIGYRRPVDHQWLASNRSGFLYSRNSQPVGYGYVGRYSGPFALLEVEDFPAVLAHAETKAAESEEIFTLMVPMVNRVATIWLLERGFRFEEGFVMLFMADTPRPGLERYLCSMPGFFA